MLGSPRKPEILPKSTGTCLLAAKNPEEASELFNVIQEFLSFVDVEFDIDTPAVSANGVL